MVGSDLALIMSPLFLTLIVTIVLIYAQMYGLLIWHVYRIGRLVPEGGYKWKMAGFSIWFTGVLVQLAIVIVLIVMDSPELRVLSTNSGVLRLAIGFVIAFSGLGCLLIAYHKLYKALTNLLSLKEKNHEL